MLSNIQYGASRNAVSNVKLSNSITYKENKAKYKHFRRDVPNVKCGSIDVENTVTVMDARNTSYTCKQLFQDTAWQWMWKKSKSMNMQ